VKPIENDKFLCLVKFGNDIIENKSVVPFSTLRPSSSGGQASGAAAGGAVRPATCLPGHRPNTPKEMNTSTRSLILCEGLVVGLVGPATCLTGKGGLGERRLFLRDLLKIAYITGRRVFRT